DGESGKCPAVQWAAQEVTVSCMFALSDFDVESGATQVAPGSHRWSDPVRAPATHEITQAVMPAGSVLFYSGNVIHAAGGNPTTDRWRCRMHLSWVLGWLRPGEWPYTAGPIRVARRL